MKLTEKQKYVIAKMRTKTPFYHNAITTYRPYTEGNYGYGAKMINGKTMNKLEEEGLITKQRFNVGGIYIYHLTELGKTITL
jgi:hypothetical protein